MKKSPYVFILEFMIIIAAAPAAAYGASYSINYGSPANWSNKYNTESVDIIIGEVNTVVVSLGLIEKMGPFYFNYNENFFDDVNGLGTFTGCWMHGNGRACNEIREDIDFAKDQHEVYHFRDYGQWLAPVGYRPDYSDLSGDSLVMNENKERVYAKYHGYDIENGVLSVKLTFDLERADRLYAASYRTNCYEWLEFCVDYTEVRQASQTFNFYVMSGYYLITSVDGVKFTNFETDVSGPSFSLRMNVIGKELLPAPAPAPALAPVPIPSSIIFIFSACGALYHLARRSRNAQLLRTA